MLRRALPVVLVVCALLTTAGFLLKAQCIGDYNSRSNTRFCVNDFQVLYLDRGLGQRRFPYVHGHYSHGSLTGGTIEYPILTGLLAWVPELVVKNDGQYLVASAALLAPFTFLTAGLLFRMARWRALLYAAAPPLIWYSFHNWDLVPVAVTVCAFWLWSLERWSLSAAFLAVGAGLKMWPGFFLLPLVLHRLRAGDRRGAANALAAAGGVTAAINVPFAVINAGGWFAPYAFQRDRAADVTSNSIWYWGLPQLSTTQLNVLIPGLVAMSFCLAAGYGWWASRDGRPYPFVQVCGSFLCAFIVLNKADSPQYTLWLLPFFALLQVRWGWVASFLGVDACLFFGLFSWYHDLSIGRDFGLAKQATVIGVWGRAILLALLAVTFLRARAVMSTGLVPPTAWRPIASVGELAPAG